MKHVFICGSKSIGQYGGYETFVNKLTEYLGPEQNIQFYILCKGNGVGYMDESKLEGVQSVGENEFIYHNARCFKLKVPNIGPAAAIWYDYMSMRFVLRYCRTHGIEKPYIYLLTCRIGPFMASLKRSMRKLGATLFVNPDGHEWMRQKWSPMVRKYWKLSEKLTVKQSDLLVCDSKNIEKYIRETYSAYHPNTTYIAYGAETTPSPLQDDDPRLCGWFREKGLTPEEYYLIVGRFVPENNYETMIREFMASDSSRKLAIITNRDDSFLAELDQRLHFSQDSRICFVGTVYDQALLHKIREKAYGYLHGHEVGGTNPSLLEALGATKLNLLLGVSFNREVGEDATLYWTKEPGSLAGLLHEADGLSAEHREDYGVRAKKRIETAFSWQYITDLYRKLWSVKA